MPRRCPECKLAAPRQRPSAPRPREDGFWRQMAASTSSDPASFFCAVWAPAGRGEWRSSCSEHWFGHAHRRWADVTSRPNKRNRHSSEVAGDHRPPTDAVCYLACIVEAVMVGLMHTLHLRQTHALEMVIRLARRTVCRDSPTINKLVDMPGIFVSHASADRSLIDPFVDDVLRLGCRVPEDLIFYSSGEDTGIPSGLNLMSTSDQESLTSHS